MRLQTSAPKALVDSPYLTTRCATAAWPARNFWLGGLVVMLGIYAAVALLRDDDGPQRQASAVAQGLKLPRAPSLLGAGGHEATHMPAPALDAQEFLPNLHNSSLLGTEVDGSWSQDAQGNLQPSKLLRRRFDYFLSLLGEQQVTALRALVDSRVRQDHGPRTAQSVMAVWDRYVQLLQYPWKTQIDLSTPAHWSTVFQERYLVRRQILGPAWADAFYKEEEGELREWMDSPNHTAGSAGAQAHIAGASSKSTHPHLLPDAPQREAQLHAQWLQWDARLQAARAHHQHIAQSAELSAPQRLATTQRYMAEHFTPGEMPRAEAMLWAHTP